MDWVANGSASDLFFQSNSGPNPAGNFDANKGLESGLSVPIFQYFRSRNSLLCHYCNVFHLSLFFGSSGTKPVPFRDELKASTGNNIQKIFNPKWTQKYDNVGGFKWSQFRPCPLGRRLKQLETNAPRHTVTQIFPSFTLFCMMINKCSNLFGNYLFQEEIIADVEEIQESKQEPEKEEVKEEEEKGETPEEEEKKEEEEEEINEDDIEEIKV